MNRLIIFLFFPITVQSQIQQFPDTVTWKKVNTLIGIEGGFLIGRLSYVQYIKA